jgi:hypothetical protein
LTRRYDLAAVKSDGRSIQPLYNQKPQYLIKSQKSGIYKVSNIKDLKNLQKVVNVLNIRWQPEEISYCKRSGLAV